MINDSEFQHQIMQWALELAQLSLESGDVPIGAVVVKNGKIIGEGYNTIERDGNSLAHAEMNAINDAIKKTGYKHLLECDIYVTLEPCAMCSGAIVLARLDNLYYAASDPKTGASGSLYSITQDDRLNHYCNVEKGIMAAESSELIKTFFRDLRNK